MEKLFKLLQIYVIERQGREQFKLHGDKIILRRPYKLRRFPQYDTNAIIISKRFGFIQWLVENDKLDISKANDKNLNGYEIELRIRAVKELVAGNEEKTVLYLNLLMLLSISDTPIEDLISYLK